MTLIRTRSFYGYIIIVTVQWERQGLADSNHDSMQMVFPPFLWEAKFRVTKNTILTQRQVKPILEVAAGDINIISCDVHPCSGDGSTIT